MTEARRAGSTGMRPLTGIALIAPCGINCGVCRAHLRARRPCPGCRGDDHGKRKTRVECRIKKCPELRSRGHRFCFACGRFPCDLVLRLDFRYRTTYDVSVIENLRAVKAGGVRAFARSEKAIWRCPRCAARICMHDPSCPGCGYAWHGRLGRPGALTVERGRSPARSRVRGSSKGERS